MAGGIISKRHLDKIYERLNQIEAGNHAMSTVIVDQQQTIAEQQRVIDALVLCVGDELGISYARAQGYRQRAMQQRSGAAEKRRRAAAENAAKGVDTSQIAAKRVPIATAGETKRPDGETQAA